MGAVRFAKLWLNCMIGTVYLSPDLILITLTAGCWHGVAWFTRITGLSGTHCAETGQVQIVSAYRDLSYREESVNPGKLTW